MPLKMYFSGRKDGNMSYNHGELSEVLDNRLGVANKYEFSAFELSGTRIIPHGFSPKMVYGNDILIIREENYKHYDGAGIMDPASIVCDAVITNCKRFPIITPNADCFPVVFHDADQNVMAFVHGARQGLFAGIIGATIDEMWFQFGCQPKNIQTHVFTGICPECYVHPKLTVSVPPYLRDYVLEWPDGTISFDLRRMIIHLLKKAGIEYILFPTGGYDGECTCHTKNPDSTRKYFSAFGHFKKVPGHEVPGNNALFLEMVDD